jgi:hypothetical protein
MAWCRVEFSSQRGHDRGVRLGKRTRGAISLRNGRSLSTEELPTALKRKKGPFKPRRGREAVPDWGGWLFGEADRADMARSGSLPAERFLAIVLVRVCSP